LKKIIANKFTTLSSRSEIRDVVDLYCLERAGYRIDDYTDDAMRKDTGATPATIAWLLSSLRVPDRLPGEVSRDAIACESERCRSLSDAKRSRRSSRTMCVAS
jgi:hypothetical protein